MFDGADTSVQALFIAPADLLAWADRIRPHIAKMAAGSGGRYRAEDIFVELAASRFLLWIALEGIEVRCVMIGQIMTYPRLRALRLTGLVGNRPWKWLSLLPAIEEQARRDFDCSRIEAMHPPRLATLLRGFRIFHLLSEKAL